MGNDIHLFENGLGLVIIVSFISHGNGQAPGT
jgi:hypothetical protein